ncbi:hypothetical protein OQA88_519 [Cercophora sp. LCS_1]
MTRPQIIRADSIDLQDRDAPTAQVHTNKASSGLLGPHQAETLREVAAETASENLRSPRVSWANGDVDDLQRYADDLAAGIAESLQGPSSAAGAAGTAIGTGTGTNRMQTTGPQQDALAIAQNGGLSGQEADDGELDGETEVDMDDDMMDKISSSPSIEDGGSSSTLPRAMPGRAGDFHSQLRLRRRLSASSVASAGGSRSTSPYHLAYPEHAPSSLQGARGQGPSFALSRRHHHHHHHYHQQQQQQQQQQYGEYGDLGREREDICGATNIENDCDCDFDPDIDTHRDEGMPRQQGKTRDFTPQSATSTCESDGVRTDSADDLDELVTEYDDSLSTSDSEDGRGITVPYNDSQDDDDDDDGDFSSPIDDPRFLDSGWGGECLQDTEDIDFEFVYALHTFVATVEGQANATKGDTMVLLDDSNSYWWLVRVVKDSSIGYLPAEHIETPTERLARLNKHRNIDLSATMLGDQAEKSRNPLKSAIKRRKTKTVQFAGNTYVDYSDIDYSTEEEDVEAGYLAQQQQQQQQAQQAQEAAEVDAEDETAKVEPLKPRGQQRDAKSDSKKQDAGADSGLGSSNRGGARTSEEIFETKPVDGPKKTSDGTVRDSFFKDDTVETKKITLTPNLLRDEGPGRSSNDSGVLKQRPSLDKLDKDVFSKDDKKKKDKKDKEKKPSVIRNFFSRKDKKTKGEEDDDSFGKRSLDADAQERPDEEEDLQGSPDKGQGVQRNPSKLQKQQPRTEPSPTRKPGGAGQRENGMDLVTFLNEGKMDRLADHPAATMRIVDAGSRDSPDIGGRTSRDQSPTASRKGPSRVPNGDVRPQQVTKAKSRAELDDFDSDDGLDLEPEPTQARSQPGSYQTGPAPNQTIKVVPANTTPPQQHIDRLSESPVHVSPVTASNPPPLMVDTSSQEEDRSSVRSSPSPELIDHEDAHSHDNKDSITTSSSTTPSWNDASLRAFFDSGSEIRDLLVVVYDKTEVEPVGPDHPITGNLFKEPNSRLAEITNQLDNMLGDWLARKQRSKSSV